MGYGAGIHGFDFIVKTNASSPHLEKHLPGALLFGVARQI
jgi:hypothetical protein